MTRVVKVKDGGLHEIRVVTPRGKVRVIDSRLSREEAAVLIAAIRAAVRKGHGVHGVYWYGGKCEVMTRRRVSAKKVAA